MGDNNTSCMICNTDIDHYGISEAHHRVGGKYICYECGRRHFDDLEKMSTTIRIKNELLEQYSRLSPKEFYRYEAYASVDDDDTVTFDDWKIHQSTIVDLVSAYPAVHVLIRKKDLPSNGKDIVVSALLSIAEWIDTNGVGKFPGGIPEDEIPY